MNDVLRDLPPARELWVSCEAECDGPQVLRCTRKAGHDGDHRDDVTGEWWTENPDRSRLAVTERVRALSQHDRLTLLWLLVSGNPAAVALELDALAAIRSKDGHS